jgi:hypothetical protein
VGRPRRGDPELLPEAIRSFSSEFRETLAIRKITVAIAAGLINSSRSEISRWRTGDDVPDERQLASLGEKLHIPRPDLMRLEALRHAAEAERQAGQRQGAASTRPPAPARPRHGLRSLWWAGATVLVLAVPAVLAGINALSSPGDSASAGDSPSAAAPEATAEAEAEVQPVTGEPVYLQCSNRDRSMLSAPGKARGGAHRGYLHPGQEFVVTGETQWWKRGFRKDDQRRQAVFVMAKYLSATGRKC